MVKLDGTQCLGRSHNGGGACKWAFKLVCHTAGNDKWQALCLIDFFGIHGSCGEGIYCFPIYL